MECTFKTILLAIISFCLISPALAQNPDLAKDLAEDGVSNEAKIEFIRVLHDPSKKDAYAEAHYYLGYLNFKEKNYDRALTHWNLLTKEYPSSQYTQKAKDQIRVAYLLLSREQELAGENIEVNSLFETASLFIDKPLKVTIDTSYLSNGDLAVQALEKIIEKFPNSSDASLALFREALVYYGWGQNGVGEYSSPEGYGFTLYAYYSHNNKQAQVYIDKMVGVINRLEKQYPDSDYIVPVAFLIGQAYWAQAGGKTNDNARVYWNKVLDLTQSDTSNTYRLVAQSRLSNPR